MIHFFLALFFFFLFKVDHDCMIFVLSTEILPLVEFVLEDGLTDEEAVHILDMSIPKQKKKGPWSETRMSSILLFF